MKTLGRVDKMVNALRRGDTPVPQNEERESAWRTTTLGEQVVLRNGKAYNADDWKTEGYPIIRIQNLKDRAAPFNYFQGDPESQVPIRAGDLVFSWSGSIGTSFGPHVWWGQLGVLNQHIFRVDLRSGSDLDQGFLYFALKHLTAEIESKAYGLAALVHVRKGDLEATKLPLPPLPEQKRIAHILSTVQRAIEAQERIIQTTTELKKALMHQLFTEGLPSVASAKGGTRGEKQKDSEIGPIPVSWEVQKVGDLAKVQSGGTPTREKKEYWQGGTIPWVKTGEIDYCVIRDTEEKITPMGLANSAARLFPAGTLLMAMYGQGITRGRVALLGIEAATNQACASITPNSEEAVSSQYLYHWFELQYENLRLLGHGANQRNMNAALIRSFPVVVAPPMAQREIAGALTQVDSKINLHRDRVIALQDLFRTLLHELMTAKACIASLDLPKI